MHRHCTQIRKSAGNGDKLEIVSEGHSLPSVKYSCILLATNIFKLFLFASIQILFFRVSML